MVTEVVLKEKLAKSIYERTGEIDHRLGAFEELHDDLRQIFFELVDDIFAEISTAIEK